MPEMPWFPFYASDWLLSRQRKRMSREARGVYVDMLAHQWEGGDLPADPQELAVILEMEVSDLHRLWPELSAAFERDGPSIRNAKLSEIREAQHKKHAERSRSGRKGASVRWGQT